MPATARASAAATGWNRASLPASAAIGTKRADGSTAELLDRLLTLSGEISTLSAAYDSARRARAEAFDGVDVEGLRTLAEGAQPPPRPASEVDREIQFYSKKIESLTEVERTNERDKAALEAQTPEPVRAARKDDCR